VSGVEATELIALGAAKLAVQEAAELIALLVEVCAHPVGQETRAQVARHVPSGSGASARRRPN